MIPFYVDKYTQSNRHKETEKKKKARERERERERVKAVYLGTRTLSG